MATANESVGLQSVVLEHRMPDGSRHFDWMIARDAQGTGGLVTFRMQRDVRTLCAGEAAPAERLADHRGAYLSYEGPISGGRGDVRRVGSGRVVEGAAPDDRSCRLHIKWEGSGGDQELGLEASDDGRWRVTAGATAGSQVPESD